MASLAEVGIGNRLAAGDKLWRATFDTAQVCAFVWAWASTTRRLGRPPTQIEYAKEWKCADRTVRRDLDRFHKVYGEDVELQRVADWLNETVAEALSKRTKALELPAPVWLGGAVLAA